MKLLIAGGAGYLGSVLIPKCWIAFTAWRWWMGAPESSECAFMAARRKRHPQQFLSVRQNLQASSLFPEPADWTKRRLSNG
jgi:hypothetical protein